jgi:hypothetical protein
MGTNKTPKRLEKSTVAAMQRQFDQGGKIADIANEYGISYTRCYYACVTKRLSETGRNVIQLFGAHKEKNND